MIDLLEFRTHLITLSKTFVEETGFAVSTASALVTNDANFFASIAGNRVVREKAYNRVMARFSALWPLGIEWPVGIPRPEPADVTEKEKARIAAFLDRRPSDIHPEWPRNEAWPADIPKPIASQPI